MQINFNIKPLHSIKIIECQFLENFLPYLINK